MKTILWKHNLAVPCLKLAYDAQWVKTLKTCTKQNLKSENIRSYKLEQQMVMSLVLVPLGGSHFLHVIIYVLSIVRLSRKHKKKAYAQMPQKREPSNRWSISPTIYFFFCRNCSHSDNLYLNLPLLVKIVFFFLFQNSITLSFLCQLNLNK